MVMSNEAKEAKNQYHREYYRTHKEQKQAANRRYWERRAARLRAEKEVTKNDG